MKGSNLIRKFLIRARLFFVVYLRRGWKSKLKHGILFKVRALLSGFWPDSLLIYDLRGWDHRQLLTDYARCVRTSLINYPNTALIDDKLIFEKFFPDTLRSVAFIYNNRIIPSLNQGLIESYPKLIIKPRTGGGGQGIKTVTREKDGYRIGEKIYSRKEWMAALSGFHNCLVYPFFEQTGFSNGIYPQTLNTIRLLTIIDRKTGDPVLLRALHRFGTSQSVPVDNWSSGGLCAPIDLFTGVLGPAFTFPGKKELIPHSTHPDSGKQIEGSQVPYWEQIKSRIPDLHREIPYIPYIGWDIVLSGEEIIILEANSNSDVNLFQVHEPLLNDPRTRSLFKDYRIVK